MNSACDDMFKEFLEVDDKGLQLLGEVGKKVLETGYRKGWADAEKLYKIRYAEFMSELEVRLVDGW